MKYTGPHRRRGRGGRPLAPWYIRAIAVDGKRSWVSTGTTSRAAAEKKLKALNAASGALDGSRGVDGWLDLWLEEIRRTCRRSTSEGLRYAARPWRKRWGETPAERIDTERVRAYLLERSESRAASTVSTERAHLRWFLRWLAREIGRELVDWSQVPKFRPSRRRPRVLRESERRRLLGVEDQEARDWIEVALETGLRRRTLLELRWEHIVDGWLRIPAAAMKRSEDFAAPLSGRALEVLEERGRVRHPSGRVFPYSRSTVYRLWSRAIAEAGLDGLKPHDLRRTFLTEARRRGVPLEVAMRLSDHRDVRVALEAYRGVLDEELERAVGREVATGSCDG